MKTLIIAALMGLSSASALASDTLYQEGNFSFIDESASSTSIAFVPVDPRIRENLYQEGNAPIVDHSRHDHSQLCDTTPPSDLYREGNYSI